MVGDKVLSNQATYAKKVLATLKRNDVDYQVLTFEFNVHTKIYARDMEGNDVKEASLDAVDLPPLAKILKNWKKILEELSKELPDTMVTVLVDGEIQLALNGYLLS